VISSVSFATLHRRAGSLSLGYPWLRSAGTLIRRFFACSRDSWKASITSRDAPSSAVVTEANEAEWRHRREAQAVATDATPERHDDASRQAVLIRFGPEGSRGIAARARAAAAAAPDIRFRLFDAWRAHGARRCSPTAWRIIVEAALSLRPCSGRRPGAHRRPHPVFSRRPGAFKRPYPVLSRRPGASERPHPVLLRRPGASERKHPDFSRRPGPSQRPHPSFRGAQARPNDHPVSLGVPRSFTPVARALKRRACSLFAQLCS
jgi:hypothetical protein